MKELKKVSIGKCLAGEKPSSEIINLTIKMLKFLHSKNYCKQNKHKWPTIFIYFYYF